MLIESRQLVWRRLTISSERVWAFIVFLLLLISYHFIYSEFFPTKNGTLGHDWSWTIPSYLVGYDAFLKNGIPFFSSGELFQVSMNPGTCHDSPGYGFVFPRNPVHFLIWLGLSPLAIAYSLFLFFAAAGFWGMYVLLRNTFKTGIDAALLGAGLFMFNGFYAHRIVIGHLYFSFMLLPLLAYCLTYRDKTDERNIIRHVFWGVLSGVVAYYSYVFSVQIIIVGFMLGLLAILAIWLYMGGSFGFLVLRSIIASIVAFGLAFESLYSIFTSPGIELTIAQRISYSFPVFRDLGSALFVLFEVLFVSPENIGEIYYSKISNLTIAQMRHELEYGLSVVPLIILVVFLAVKFWEWLGREEWGWHTTKAQMFYLMALIAILAFPLLYTTNVQDAHLLFKRIPILNATTSPQRTFALYVATLPILAALAISQIIKSEKWLRSIVALSLLGIVVSVLWKDRGFYHAQPYDPGPVLEAHKKMKATGTGLPPIERLGVLGDGQGTLLHNQMVEANLFLRGVQHLGCYVPGYGSVPMEYLGTLHPGSIWDEKSGYYNIQNPACNTWPKENGCRPGEHFKVEQKDWLEQYANYRSFPVQVPEQAHWAARLSAISFFGVLVFLVGFALWRNWAARSEMKPK